MSNLRWVWNICSLNTPLSDLFGFPCRRKHSKPGCKGGNTWLESIMQLIPASNILWLISCYIVSQWLRVFYFVPQWYYLICFNCEISSAFSFFVFTDINLDCQIFSSMSRFTAISSSHKQTSNIYCHVITHTIVGMYWENRSITVCPHWYEEEMWLRHLAW